MYFHYYGEISKALEHFLACENWQKAHSILVTSVAHSLFLSGKISNLSLKSISPLELQFVDLSLFSYVLSRYKRTSAEQCI